MNHEQVQHQLAEASDTLDSLHERLQLALKQSSVDVIRKARETTSQRLEQERERHSNPTRSAAPLHPSGQPVAHRPPSHNSSSSSSGCGCGWTGLVLGAAVIAGVVAYYAALVTVEERTVVPI
ncbi:hypothetical protein CAOG_05732 [Capsaspora owczarzaki ATCC 30864]|uniref:hypothetical protein n=1 Tax=Capsaspora owczarzaki (strain ATCC 30864) TaxID=595528 RepID=UPI0001FE63DF|nr:hypothetical protein CAOG_05732 [Capsaspora owczarzaki ATCC 30864]|eukprot:XP_004346405.1 hypothetical protein CAOG_05732 [Capsaspora owczarzaki ATCC 30864]